MRGLAKTAAVAVASSLTTALLFVACTVDNSGQSAAPTAAPVATTPGGGGGQTAAAGEAVATPGIPRVTVAAARAQGAQQSAPGPQSPAMQVYQRNGASVVNITSLAVVRTRQGQATQPQGIGSGFIIDADGRIVTNNHVVQDAAQLQVTFQDRTTVPAKLLGRDAANDVAVIQVDPNATDSAGKSVRDKIKPATFGDSDSVTIGEYAVAIGSPLGLQQTVTQGIVSAIRNPGEESAQGSLDLLSGAIQTDASINPGNSGGPLFNAAGEVIGVNSAILSQSGGNEGIGFSIPINVVKRMAPELIQTGQYRHPLMGITSISLAALSPQAKQQLGLAANQEGLLVLETSAGAAQAGIKGGSRTVSVGGENIPAGGDIIVALDGQLVTTSGDLRGTIENTKHPGDTVAVTVLRNGQRQDFSVTLTERPPDTNQSGSSSNQPRP